MALTGPRSTVKCTSSISRFTTQKKPNSYYCPSSLTWYTRPEGGHMSEILVELNKRLERIEKNDKKTDKWWISPLTTIIIVLVGLAVQWGMINVTVENLELRVGKLELQVATLIVSQTRDDEIIKGMKANLEEIKTDVKWLRGRRR